MSFKIEALQEFYTVGVKFDPTLEGEVSDHNKEYVYKVDMDVELKEGDFVVVEAVGQLKVVIVTEVHLTPQINYNGNTAYKWVLQKVEVDAYKEKVKEEQYMKHNLKLLEANQQRDIIRKAFIEQFGEKALEDLKKPKLNSPFKTIN